MENDFEYFYFHVLRLSKGRAIRNLQSKPEQRVSLHDDFYTIVAAQGISDLLLGEGIVLPHSVHAEPIFVTTRCEGHTHPPKTVRPFLHGQGLSVPVVEVGGQRYLPGCWCLEVKLRQAAGVRRFSGRCSFHIVWLKSVLSRRGFQQELGGRLYPMRHHFSHSLHQFVAQVMIPLTAFAQTRSVEENRLCRLQCSRSEMLVVRRQDPRPTEFSSWSDCLNQDRFAVLAFEFHSYFAAFNQVKAVRWIALPKDELASREFHLHRAVGQQLEMLLTHPLEEGLSCYGRQERAHGFLS